ncbi:MAG TPA: site-specific integrase, partial [Actinomycetota bacterium]
MISDSGSSGISVEQRRGCWRLAGPEASQFGLVNDYLGYLTDRNYSPRTLRAYAFDLLHFARWLLAEALALTDVTVDSLLRYLAASREALVPGRHGGNVASILDGRSAGYSPA